MDDATLIELSDLNLAESAREMARWRSEWRVDERDDLLCIAGADAFPVGYTNAVLALGRAPAEPQHTLDAARAFFEPLERGFTVWTRGHLDAALADAARDAGLQPLGDMPGMVLEHSVPETEASRAIAPIETTQELAEFAQVQAAAYGSLGMPEAVVQGLFAEPTRVLAPHVVVALARDGATPLSGALAILSHGIAGVYWVGTAPAGRKRGLGDACTRRVSIDAFARGARAVVLQASPMGEPVYLAMGYRELTRYAWWVHLRRA
jgi:ribosomal protein S18 acetylase RimI-like enzyme